MSEQAPASADRSGPLTVYVSIGNSDDKLSQKEWNRFWVAFRFRVFNYAERVHGDWHSIPFSPYQNACLCIEIPRLAAETLRAELRKLAAEFGQDSIAWAEALTDFLEPRQEP